MDLLLLGARRRGVQAPTLRVPGARWRPRLARCLGAHAHSWPGHALIGPSLAPRLGVVLAHDEPFEGFSVVLRYVPPGSGGPARWQPALLADGGWLVGERVHEVRGYRDMEPGRAFHLQRHGCTVRRAEGGLRCVELDGGLFSLLESDDGSVELRSPLGGRARACFDADGALSWLSSAASTLTSARDEATGHLASLDRASGAEPGTPVAVLTRDDHQRVRRIGRRHGDECLADYDEAGRLILLRCPGEELRIDYAEVSEGAPDRVAAFAHGGLGSWTLAPSEERGWIAVSERGRTRIASFDAFGGLVREMTPDGRTRELERDSSNGAVTALRGDGTELSYVYDLDGFVVYADETDGPHYELEYDPEGRLTRASVPGSGRFRRVFDAEGRLATVSTPEGTRELRWAEDDSGVWVLGGAGEVFVTLRGGRVHGVAEGERSWSLTQAEAGFFWLIGSDGQQLYFGEDAGGRERWGASGAHDAAVQRDRGGRVLAYASGSDSVRAERDARGDIVRIEHGAVVTRGEEGRVVRVEVGSLVEERRHGPGGLVSVRRGGSIVRDVSPREGGLRAFAPDAGVLDVRLDGHGRLARLSVERDGWSSAELPSPTWSFERDERGGVRRAEHDGHALAIERVDGRIVRERAGADEVTSARDAHGARLGVRTSRGLGLTMERDAGRIVRLRAEWAEHAQEVELRYDGAGREIERRIGALSMRFDRDALGRVVKRGIVFDRKHVDETSYAYRGARLCAVSSSGGSASCELEHHASGALMVWVDARGERHELTPDVAAIPFGPRVDGVSYDAVGRPEAVGGARYDHSAAGLLRMIRREKGPQRFDYDALGRLRSIRSEELEVDLARDAFGRIVTRRARRYVMEAPTGDVFDTRRQERVLLGEPRLDLVWDGPRLVHRQASDAPGTSYVWADGLLVLTVRGGEPFFVVPGPFGDPDALLAESGELVWTRDPRTLIFGTVDAGAREHGVPSLPEHHFDPESGLWHSLFRSLDPATGRYLTPNPLGLCAGPGLHAPPVDPIRGRMRFGIGRPLEPFWSELADDGFDARWARFVLEQLGGDRDEQGLRAWRARDELVAPSPGGWLLDWADLGGAHA